MNIDTGLAVVLAAVLIFYLRLIILQRERAKRVRRELEAAAHRPKKKKGKQPAPAVSYSILTKNRINLAIAGIGALAVIFGALLYAQVIPLAALQATWWLPTAAGIIAFSWAFQL